METWWIYESFLFRKLFHFHFLLENSIQLLMQEMGFHYEVIWDINIGMKQFGSIYSNFNSLKGVIPIKMNLSFGKVLNSKSFCDLEGSGYNVIQCNRVSYFWSPQRQSTACWPPIIVDQNQILLQSQLPNGRFHKKKSGIFH